MPLSLGPVVKTETNQTMDPCAFDKLFTKSVPHILEKIFFSLDYHSFKISKEVSNTWKKVLASEAFKRMGKSVFHRNIRRELFHALKDGDADKVSREAIQQIFF